MKHIYLVTLISLFISPAFSKIKQTSAFNTNEAIAMQEKSLSFTNQTNTVKQGQQDLWQDERVFQLNNNQGNQKTLVSSLVSNDILIYGVVGIEIGISIVLFIAFMLYYLKSHKKQDFSLLTFS